MGGCQPPRIQSRRDRCMEPSSCRSSLRSNRFRVARPMDVFATIRSPFGFQIKCSLHRSLRGLNCNQPLFNPRKDLWSEHFIWNPEGDRIVAKTSIGRATLNRLDLNDDRHDDGSIQRSRRLWIRGGWHPPIGD